MLYFDLGLMRRIKKMIKAKILIMTIRASISFFFQFNKKSKINFFFCINAFIIYVYKYLKIV